MIEKFKKIFEGSDIGYGTFEMGTPNGTEIKRDGSALTYKGKPPSHTLWQEHLSGKGIGLGIIPINSESKCKWGCLDIDAYKKDNKELVKKIEDLKLPLIVCRSKSGGAHAFLFSKTFISASLMKIKISSYAAALRIGNDLDRTYPVQEKIIKGKGHVGSFLNLPYYNAEEGSRYAYKPDGSAASLQEFFDLYDEKSLTESDFEIKKPVKDNNPYREAPPCLVALQKGVGEGGRDDALMNYAMFYKKAYPEFGIDKKTGQKHTWQQLTREANRRYMKPSMDEKQVEKVINQVENNDYNYFCHCPTLKEVCQSELCKTKTYGIGDPLLKNIIGDIVEYGHDRYLVDINVDPKQEVFVEGKTLMYENLFREYCMQQVQVMLPKFKKGEFERMMLKKFNERAKSADYVSEASEDFRFIKYLGQYVNHKKAYTDPKVLLTYKSPYFEQKKNYLEFNLDDFEDYLASKGEKIKRPDLVRKIQTVLKAKRIAGKINKKSAVRWRIENYDMEDDDLIVEGEVIETKEITND